MPPIASPCTGICTLDQQQVCLGCGRTLAEIGRWAQASVAEQAEIVHAAAQRRVQQVSAQGQPLKVEGEVDES